MICPWRRELIDMGDRFPSTLAVALAIRHKEAQSRIIASLFSWVMVELVENVG